MVHVVKENSELRGAEDKQQRREDGRQRMDDGGRWIAWTSFHSAFDIVEAVEVGRFPDKAMITVHPQRWTDNPVA